MSAEFDLIARYFTRPAKRAVLGVGDDCALIGLPEGRELAISTDTLVCGTHFFPDADPHALGCKALAVNLSDLAAMGALPRYATLALTLPSIDAGWLDAFARGLFEFAAAYDVELIGGDTTRGPLSFTLTVFGEVASGKALRRDAARAGDDVWLSGRIGGAALALAVAQGDASVSSDAAGSAALRLHRPQPRVALGLRISGIAHAAIDVSDGLLADLGHIGERSRLDAEIDWPRVPVDAALDGTAEALRRRCALTGGDDYELCFTASLAERARIEALNGIVDGVAITRIGRMVMASGPGGAVRVLDAAGRPVECGRRGYDHFTPTRESGRTCG
ncbi:MAG TPA: thiamine-phosphate kinase [Usitatibacteraceae bacterium]|nr:thiamine-phosphate kinase [Usitatibacteraceae bacterium]